jgi:hypothetical protein
MDRTTRGFMERALGEDFRQVRVHADDRAAEATRSLGARALATGEHLHFARGDYAPGSDAGRQLLAHELAHVVQQRRLGRPLVQAQPAPGAAPLGAIDQAQVDVTNALTHAVERVQQAIDARDGIGILPHDVDAALCQYFRGFGPELLDDILARLQPMTAWVPNIPVFRVPRPAPAGFRDAALLNLVPPPQPAQAMVRRELPAMDPGDDYVAVFPEWDGDASLQATRLLHEIFHFGFVGMFHAGPLNDAFAWQGFVSSVARLQTGAALQGRFPACP